MMHHGEGSFFYKPDAIKIVQISVEKIVPPGEEHNILFLDNATHVHVSDEDMEKYTPTVGDYYNLETQQIMVAKS